MFGITNAKVYTYGADEHTVFLLTDSLYDKSKNHVPVYPLGQIGESCCANMSSATRDGRNYILLGSKTCLMLGKADLIPGPADWTFECWRYVLNNTSNGCIYFQRPNYSSPYGLLIGHSTPSPHSGLYISNNTSSWDVVNGADIGASSMPVNSWHHMAICKNGNTYYCFVDGVLKNTITASVTYTQTLWRNAFIGGFAGNTNNPAPTGVISGYFQDFRISDICRYTANFTPPVAF